MIQPTTHPNESKNLLIAQEVFSGGEGGIRTLDTLRYTRSPGARTRPDYATSPYFFVIVIPFQRAALYHKRYPGNRISESPGANSATISDESAFCEQMAA